MYVCVCFCVCKCDCVILCVKLFSEVVSTGSSKEELGSIRDLAKKLALSFGIDLLRIRTPLVSLHM